MIKVYPAIFYKEEDSFWVEFPDLIGCQTVGDTLEETMENAMEALGLYLASKLDNEEDINNPSDINSIKICDGFVSYVSIDINKYRKRTKAVKKTLSIPEWLNKEAEKNHINFSSVLQKALIDELQK